MTNAANIFENFDPDPPPQAATPEPAPEQAKPNRRKVRATAPGKPGRKPRQAAAAAPAAPAPRRPGRPRKEPGTTLKKARGSDGIALGAVIAATAGLKPEELDLFRKMITALEQLKSGTRGRLVAALGRVFS